MIVLKAALVMAVALLVAAAMRHRSAAARHRALATALLLAALMPLLVGIVPAWSLRGVPSQVPGDGGSVGAWLPWLWIAGTAVAFARIALEFVRLRIVAARATVATTPSWAAAAEELARELDVSRDVALVEIDLAMMPVTWGIWRPTVLLPRAAREWTDDRVRAVLAHELAHVRRLDWATQLGAELVTAMYWFNPLAWALRRRLRHESERACDDAVLCAGVSGADYASHLLDVARALRDETSSWRAAPAIARPTHLERRVAAILNGGLDRAPVISRAGTLAAAVIVGLAAAAAGFGEAPRSPGFRQAAVTPMERNIMMRFGGVEKRLSVVTGDVAFRRDRIAGRVVLQARLGVDGWPTAVRIVEPTHPDLAIAAEDIMRQWHREPARLRGVPVEVPIRMTIDFKDAP